MTLPGHNSKASGRRCSLLCLSLLLALVAVVWVAHHGLWSLQSWQQPILYAGDGWWGMASAKAMAAGEIAPIVSKYPVSLGAPYHANWNDYPSVEEGVNAWWALLVEIFGLFAGSNLTVLSAHLLAATGFYFVGRELRYHPVANLVGSSLFALSTYSFFRGLGHIALTFYWHVPLGLLVCWWVMQRTPILASRRKVFLALVVTICFGVQNPYYTGMYLQGLVLCGLLSVLRWRDWKRARFPGALLLLSFLLFGFVNLDTFYNRYMNGKDAGTVLRAYGELELYGLKPIELFLPRWHSLPALQEWSRQAYYTKAWFLGEAGSPYLGVIGIAAGLLLAAAVFRNIARGGETHLPIHFFALLWVTAFSVVGGLNSLLGLSGMVFFRGGNRYSIFLLAILLLFLVKQLSILFRGRSGAVIAGLAAPLLIIGIYDEVPPKTFEQPVKAVAAAVAQDSVFVARLESALPPGAMVFELPVADFPENTAVGGLGDYEEFRPYLYSRHLRFSYGSPKGRTSTRWQKDTEQLGLPQLATLLERYGFSAIVVFRRGYADNGASAISALLATHPDGILAESTDLAAIALHPIARPEFPPEFADGWYTLEGNAQSNIRWSAGNAVLRFYHPGSGEQKVRITFGIGSLGLRHLTILQGDREIYQAELGQAPTAAFDQTLTLHPGENILRFVTDRQGTLPGNGDGRKLAFHLINFEKSEAIL